MRLHNIVLSLQAWLRNLQEFDASYASYGPAYPDWKDDWSDQLFSLVYTRFGSKDPEILDSYETDSLRGKFMNALESRFCRLNGQEVITRLEKVLDDALTKHGEEEITILLLNTQRLAVQTAGHEFVSRLKKAGLIFADEARFDRLIKRATAIQENEKPAEPKFTL